MQQFLSFGFGRGLDDLNDWVRQPVPRPAVRLGKMVRRPVKTKSRPVKTPRERAVRLTKKKTQTVTPKKQRCAMAYAKTPPEYVARICEYLRRAETVTAAEWRDSQGIPDHTARKQIAKARVRGAIVSAPPKRGNGGHAVKSYTLPGKR